MQALCYGEHDSKQKRWLAGLSAYLPCLAESNCLEDSESKVISMMAQTVCVQELSDIPSILSWESTRRIFCFIFFKKTYSHRGWGNMTSTITGFRNSKKIERAKISHFSYPMQWCAALQLSSCLQTSSHPVYLSKHTRKHLVLQFLFKSACGFFLWVCLALDYSPQE